MKRAETTKCFKEPFPNKKIRSFQFDSQAETFILGRLQREKYYIFIKNIHTQRTFSISVDFCSYLKQKMAQVEIEYKWIQSDDKVHSMNLEEILTDDYKPIVQCINALPIKPTTLTKFE